MKVGAYEAKTHFSALFDRVENGERIEITRHGRIVAILSAPPGAPDRTAADAIDEIMKFRERHTLGEGLTIRDLIDAGRR
jgi:prevent-host-death family protein